MTDAIVHIPKSKKTKSLPLLPRKSEIAKAYGILGLREGASHRELDSTFHRLALEHHSDRTHGSDDRMIDIIWARDILKLKIVKGRPRKHLDIQGKGYVIVDQDGVVCYPNSEAQFNPHLRFKSRKIANEFLQSLLVKHPGFTNPKRPKTLRVVGNAAAERQAAKRRRKKVSEVKAEEHRQNEIALILGHKKLSDLSPQERKKIEILDDDGNTIKNPYEMDRGSYFIGPEVPHGAARIHTGGINSKKVSEITAARDVAVNYDGSGNVANAILDKEHAAIVSSERNSSLPPARSSRPRGGPDAFENDPSHDELDTEQSSAFWDDQSEYEFQNSEVTAVAGGRDRLLGPSAEDRETPLIEGVDELPIYESSYVTVYDENKEPYECMLARTEKLRFGTPVESDEETDRPDSATGLPAPLDALIAEVAPALEAKEPHSLPEKPLPKLEAGAPALPGPDEPSSPPVLEAPARGLAEARAKTVPQPPAEALPEPKSHKNTPEGEPVLVPNLLNK